MAVTLIKTMFSLSHEHLGQRGTKKTLGQWDSGTITIKANKFNGLDCPNVFGTVGTRGTPGRLGHSGQNGTLRPVRQLMATS